MATDASAPRRVRIERNIYQRANGVFEVGFKDAGGKQRWRTINGGITAARAARDQVLSQRHRNELTPSRPKLRFREAAEAWLDGPVADLRPGLASVIAMRSTRTYCSGSQAPGWTRSLPTISPRSCASFAPRDLSESTGAIVIGVVNRIYRFAARRLEWCGTNPVSLMLSSERPKPSQTKRRRIFEGAELEQTIAAAREPWRTLFTVAALTGARVSELLALTWADVSLDDLDEAQLDFAWQVDRQGRRGPTKTDGSARVVPIPRELALVLVRHKLAARFVEESDFVFATRTGGALRQFNVGRALRKAQRDARDEHGDPTFLILHETGENGEPLPVPRGALPSMHSFRCTVASRALLAGESIDEIAFLLGHRDANVTRAVYVRELADARRRAMRRSRMVAEFSEILKP